MSAAFDLAEHLTDVRRRTPPLDPREIAPSEWQFLEDLIPAIELRAAVRRAPRFQPLPYVPGFGGHRRRGECRCTEADEFICGEVHPDAHESEGQIKKRREAALAVSEREARQSAIWADAYGTGANRDVSLVAELRGKFDDAIRRKKFVIAERLRDTIIALERKEPYKRPSKTKAEKVGPKRQDRPLSDAEWRQALIWIRRQPLPAGLKKQRIDICAQTWLELRRPPATSGPSSFLAEVRRAWERARIVIREENQTTWSLPGPSEIDAGGRHRPQTFHSK